MQHDNYTTNPDRPDIDFTCFLDGGQAQRTFVENFIQVDKRNEHLWLYTDNGNLPDTVELVSIPARLNTKNAIAAALDELSNSWYSYKEDVKEYSLQELVDELEDLAVFDDDYTDTLDEHGIKYKVPYDMISISGYSQGDYATVIIPTKAAEKTWGIAVDLDKMQRYCERIFFGAPLYFHCDIDNNEYDLFDFWNDEYNYDKYDFIDEFMALVKKKYSELSQQEYIREFLENNLPDYPEYIY